MASTTDSTNLITHLQKIFIKQPESLKQILQYVPGEHQLDIAMKCPSLKALIAGSRNLKSIPDFSDPTIDIEQKLALHDKNVYSRAVDSKKPDGLIGKLVEIRLSGEFSVKGVILNRTKNCVQSKDWVDDVRDRMALHDKSDDEMYPTPFDMRMMNTLDKEHFVVLLDAGDLRRIAKEDRSKLEEDLAKKSDGIRRCAESGMTYCSDRLDQAREYYLKSEEFMKKMYEQHRFSKLHESWHWMMYISRSELSFWCFDKEFENPFLHKYFTGYCSEEDRYIMNDLWASQHPADVRKPMVKAEIDSDSTVNSEDLHFEAFLNGM